MTLKRLILCCIMMGLMALSYNAWAGANEGSVKGTVHKNSASGKTLSGVKVKCGGESDKTDDDGKFKIKGIKKGEHTIKFSKDGYEAYETKVKIKTGETANVGDRWLVKESSSGVKSGSGSCPSGNGLYCGDSGKGQNTDHLYRCSNGTYSLASSCANGCQKNAAGKDDTCKPVSAVVVPNPGKGSTGSVFGTVRKESASGKKLSGVLVVCGEKSDKTNDDGEFKIKDVPAGNQTITFSKDGYETYSREVEIKAGHTAKLEDRWLVEGTTSSPGKCPSGNGLYCGDAGKGQNAINLYQCTNGTYSLKTSCGSGCQKNAAGKDDSCKTISPGSSGQVAGAMTEKVKPVVNSFSLNKSKMTVNDTVSISYVVSDDSGLKQVELWRSNNNKDWAEVEPNEKRQYLSGKTRASGFFTDSPSSSGVYYYGVHVVDIYNNWDSEGGSKKIDVGPAGSKTSAKNRIVEIAKSYCGHPSGPSQDGGLWGTDCSGGDGQRIINAFKEYQRTKDFEKMKKQLVPTYKDEVINKVRYTDRTTLANKILSVYNNNEGRMPEKCQDVIDLLGIQRQCFEWANTVALEGDGHTVSSDGGKYKIKIKDIVPGDGLYWSNGKHSMIVTNVTRSNNAVTVGVAESNYAIKWNNPPGDIPWERKVSCGRLIVIKYDKDGLIGVDDKGRQYIAVDYSK